MAIPSFGSFKFNPVDKGCILVVLAIINKLC